MDNFRSLENIEDTEDFFRILNRASQTKKLSPSTPYVFWSTDFRNADPLKKSPSPLAAFSADFYHLAERLHLPFVVITPFQSNNPSTSYTDLGYSLLDSTFVRTGDKIHHLDIVQKSQGSARILSIVLPDLANSIEKSILLGFGGYRALKFIGVKPSIMHLNGPATVFSAIARLDELVHSGVNLYEALVYVRKHTIYTEHSPSPSTNLAYPDFLSSVCPNIKSPSVKNWLKTCFKDNIISLNSLAIELAEAKNLTYSTAKTAKHLDIFGEKPNFALIPSGIDIKSHLKDDFLGFYQKSGILTPLCFPAKTFKSSLSALDFATILSLKKQGRSYLISILKDTKDYKGDAVKLKPTDILFCQNSLSGLALTDTSHLRSVLESHHAHLIVTGTINKDDTSAISSLKSSLSAILKDSYLRTFVHFLPASEDLSLALSVGANVFINSATSSSVSDSLWQKHILGLSLMISDSSSFAGFPTDSYLSISGKTDLEKSENLYDRMGFAASAWSNPFDLELYAKSQLSTFLPTISGVRMLKSYLSLIFSLNDNPAAPDSSNFSEPSL